MKEFTLKNKIKPCRENNKIIIETDGLQRNDMFLIKAEYCKQNKEKCRQPQLYMALEEIENNKWKCSPLLTNVRICKTIPAGESFYITTPNYAIAPRPSQET